MWKICCLRECQKFNFDNDEAILEIPAYFVKRSKNQFVNEKEKGKKKFLYSKERLKINLSQYCFMNDIGC